MSTNYDVAVLGAGIVGAACARECVRAGMSVVVIERDTVANGATGAAMGHVVVMDLYGNVKDLLCKRRVVGFRIVRSGRLTIASYN